MEDFFAETKKLNLSKFQIPKINFTIGAGFSHWNLVVGSFFVLWLLLISLIYSCGELPSELATIEINPSRVTLGVNNTRQFSAVGKSSVGNIVSDFTPTWRVEGDIGSIYSTSGSYATFLAGWKEGTGYIVASYGSIEGRAQITVTVNGWLNGWVKDVNGQRVSGMHVYLKGTSLGSLSDSDGYYLIGDIPPGTYEARIDATSYYQEISAEVTISSGETERWDPLLKIQEGIPPVPTTTFISI
ncbi:MAG: carboxypeptidase-like regulatory domain-containing protein [Candidatus Margulisiibacteriota bacterium]